jgi:hypothetical protein
MSQPVGFQKGWESEKGGNWMLSKLAFIANPGNNGDDIGWDAFCTHKMHSSDGFLPGRAFTVQIKSNRESIVISHARVQYFRYHTLPFFIAVFDRMTATLSLYSAHYLPMLFSHFGIPTSIRFKLVDSLSHPEFVKFTDTDEVVLNCHRVCVLNPSATDTEFSGVRNETGLALRGWFQQSDKPSTGRASASRSPWRANVLYGFGVDPILSQKLVRSAESSIRQPSLHPSQTTGAVLSRGICGL